MQVVDIERDIIKAKKGAGNELVYKTITGLESDLRVASKHKLLQKEEKTIQPINGKYQFIYKFLDKFNSIFICSCVLFFFI